MPHEICDVHESNSNVSLPKALTKADGVTAGSRQKSIKYENLFEDNNKKNTIVNKHRTPQTSRMTR